MCGRLSKENISAGRIRVFCPFLELIVTSPDLSNITNAVVACLHVSIYSLKSFDACQ